MKKILSAILIAFTLVACGKDETLSSKTYTFTDDKNNVQITLGFDTTQQRYFGNVVNRFFGTYETSGKELTFSDAGSTRMMGPQNAMIAEQEFFAILPQIVSYELKGEKLILKTADDQEFEFTETPSDK